MILLLGCIGRGEPIEDPTGPAADMLRREAWSDQSDRNGVLSATVPIEDGDAAFLLTVESDYYPVLETVYDPSGQTVLSWEDWTDSDQSLTWAFFWGGKAMAFNWPVREQDGPLAPGDWTVDVALVDSQGYYASRKDAELVLHRKQDPDLAAGTVRARIVWAEGEGGDEDVRAAAEQAVERWREVWAAQGLVLEESWHDSELPSNLSFADSGSAKVEENAERFEGRELILVLGESIQGQADTYGVAGGIPGSIEPTRSTYVVVSWLAHAGNNGRFDEDEIRLMGETMAHECGHFMGLFHPVESSYDAWDALDDTEDCRTWQSCENKLGENLMFPYPICDWQECAPQPDLSEQQRGVAHRYLGSL